MRLRTGIALGCLLGLLLSSTAAVAERETTLSFERLGDDWVPSPLDGNTGELSVIAKTTGPHIGAIKIPGKTPKAIGVTYYPWRDWTGYTTLSFDVFFPPEMPKKTDFCVYIKDRQYWWFQTYPLRDPKTGKRARDLKAGSWETYSLDISEDSAIWQPGGHKRSWDRVLYYPREFGIRIFCEKPWQGAVLLDDVLLSGNEPPLGKIPARGNLPTRWDLQLSLSAGEVPVYEKLEVTFKLDRDYANPFDPEVVQVTGHFLLPGGREMLVPGFYYQAYERSQTEEGWEKLIPVGAPCWKVRFSPTEQGRHRFYVSVRDATGELRSKEHTFSATSPTDPRGPVRVSERDPMYFEFENGEFFFPIGLNMRDGGDHAERQQGTYAFDQYFKRFREEGLNFVRTWMCAWWAGVEWDDDYHSRYDGLGRYCMYNAWRLDYLFDLADQYDLFIELTFNSHGQLRRDKYDAEWRYNPYAARNGGFVPSPAMFFTNDRVKEYFRQRYRYIVARWGYSQHLMSYDLWNEVDLVEGPNAREIGAWHSELGAYLKSIDPWKHIVCSHVCLHGSSVTEQFWQVPELEYIQADEYWGKTRAQGMNKFFDKNARHRHKPMLFIEYGPQTAALPVPFSEWQRDFRVGAWVSNTMPMGAVAQFWYQDAWQKYELHRYQKGLIAFNEGEDRRGLDFRKVKTMAVPVKQIAAQAMVGEGVACLYAFSWDNMYYTDPDRVPAAKRIKDGRVTILDLPAGRYRVEFWDTISGEVSSQATIEASGERTILELPEFAQDIACKLKKEGQ